MRRLASEIINELEMRIDRLERQAKNASLKQSASASGDDDPVGLLSAIYNLPNHDLEWAGPEDNLMKEIDGGSGGGMIEMRVIRGKVVITCSLWVDEEDQHLVNMKPLDRYFNTFDRRFTGDLGFEGSNSYDYPRVATEKEARKFLSIFKDLEKNLQRMTVHTEFKRV